MRNGPYELIVAPTNFPGKRYRNRYCYKHHLIWWENTGEILGKDEVIHHKNRDKADNRFSNLEKKDRSIHSKEHGNEKHVPLVNHTCGYCNQNFQLISHKSRTRLKASKSGKLYCSLSCQMKDSHRNRKNIPS